MVCDLHNSPAAPHGAATTRRGFGVSGKQATRLHGGEAMGVRILLLAILITTTTLPARAGDRITMRVSPSISFAPANLSVRATIEADAENRAVVIVAESADFYRSSEIQLDGGNGPRTNMLEFRSLPPGRYEVRAALFGADGQQRGLVRQQVSVIAGGAGH
jgi:hypothetical protein